MEKLRPRAGSKGFLRATEQGNRPGLKIPDSQTSALPVALALRHLNILNLVGAMFSKGTSGFAVGCGEGRLRNLS